MEKMYLQHFVLTYEKQSTLLQFPDALTLEHYR